MRIVGHGIDMVDVARISRILDEHGDTFTGRCFTESERCYADAARNRRAERYAARFACKEAVLKALGTGWSSGISWQDIDVQRMPSGQPRLRLSGRCEQISHDMGIRNWHVSISHAGDYAVASVIGAGAPASES